jgi:hypothetical protein
VSQIMDEQVNTKRVSFDLRGEHAELFEEWRKELSDELGFQISPSKAVLWMINQIKKSEE